uniref:Uncharacterized protein n=1 Tax=Caenorhabditis japonica TaxID=281687 RepID=A0A8R1ET39_CAEJA
MACSSGPAPLLYSLPEGVIFWTSFYSCEPCHLYSSWLSFEERMILFQLSGNLAKLETDVEFDIISENDMDPLQNLINHLNGSKSG